ncbi:MAG TPA: patatin-like phospholipase family protein [Tepidisphaeraceae bacterium]|jgi:predicted acylesterase/phospholipase RssA|nr:patatin-like phospholipase family protein [Tepidisphaeraceae bacterium]
MANNRFHVGTLMLAVALAGCAAPTINVALNGLNVPLEDRRVNHTRAEVFGEIVPLGAGRMRTIAEPGIVMPSTRAAAREPGAEAQSGYFVGLAISGGGSRSANFAAACMLQLQRLGVLQHVGYISSVSGGSLPAAYYCVSGNEWNPGNVQAKMSQAFADEALRRAFLPWNIVTFLFTNYDQSDLLADVFSRRLFSRGGRGLTFADLRPDRPRLLINATDLQSGQRFVFCNESFDALNSDLAKYPIAYAVTASSAVPVALHPITLRDYSTIFPEYRHLIDGGVADNLGVQTLVETYNAQVDAAARAGRADPYPRGAVFLVIDARTDFDVDLANQSHIGMLDNLKAAAGLTSTALLNRVSTATLSDLIVRNAEGSETAHTLRQQIAALQTTGYLQLKDRSHHEVQVVYINLSQIAALHDLPFAGFANHLNDIDTYFSIPAGQAYWLYEAADLLISRRFERRLREIADDLSTAGAATAPATAPATVP